MPSSELHRLVPQAPPALCRILNAKQGRLEAPLRAELFGLQRFAEHGASLALTHSETSSRKSRETFFPRLQDNIVQLRAAFEYISVQANAGYDISPAAEWLVENFHLLEAQFKEVSEGLPLSYFRALPVLVQAPLAGLPRIYAIAWSFVAHTDGAFDDDLLVHFLQAYQQQCELNLSELWALPTTLRVVLMESLRRLAERVAANKAARELANLCCDHLESYDLDALDALHHLLERRGVGRTFLAQVMQRLQENHDSSRAIYMDWVQLALPDFAATQTQQRADQAADNLSVSNAVTALRAIGDADWGDIVTRTSPLMALLLSSEVFAAEHTLTRDTTLHAIERLARRCRCSETVVANALLQKMAARDAGSTPQDVPSHWLQGQGRDALYQALGHHRPLILWRPSRQSTLALYLGALLLITLAWIGTMMRMTPALDGLPLVVWLLLAFPVTEAVLALINRLVSESSRPSHLHRLAFANGIPPEHSVLVVIPCMLGDRASIGSLAHRLRLHYLANLEPQAQFALLTDWLDAPTQEALGDTDLLECAQAEVAALNRLHPWPQHDADRPARFILLHRARSFSHSEQAWIGWERKRGKLEALVNALATGKPGPFLDLGPLSQLAPNARYVVTLDSDTQLPPGRLRDLVGVAAHPYNQPQIDPGGQRVVSGYGILQPRVVSPLPARDAATRFHWLFAGQFGMDPYSAASSEVYQDLFGEGSFSGKGLLHVAAVHATLSGQLPNEQILSHDLLEGALARCATVTDITLMEDAPFHADVAASRLHRWTRGDWQLLPFLLHPSRHGLSALNAWKLADNLRRSLVAPASLLLLLAALFFASVPLAWTLLVVLAAYSSGPLIGAAAGCFPGRGKLSRWHFAKEALADLARALGAGVWHLALLLHNALLSIDAVARALYRTAVSRRHLLQWTTAASAQSSARFQLQALVLQHRSAPLAALVIAVVLVAWGATPVASAFLCLLWGGAPVWIWFASRTLATPQGDALRPPEQQYLLNLARDTWRYFERTVTATDLHLPPDNLQVTPHDMLAHRTSPTNIGLYLLSVACAREFGWIATQELLDRLEATLGTLQGLPREHGHFLNWYDTQTGAPLLPTYVSTVDSGNLSAHLLCVAQACRALAAAPDDAPALQGALLASQLRIRAQWRKRHKPLADARQALRWLLQDHRALLTSRERSFQRMTQTAQVQAVQRLQTLAHALEALAWQPDFKFLYHTKRHLLHIGYRPADRQLDAGFYDLLASEARLTSLVAIAKGDVPVAHWSALGRMFCVLQGQAGLRSWSGSMFEYLMPGLVIAEPAGSVLADACAMALREQMAFAKPLQVPWGMSESAFAARDQSLAYQYAPQGAPRLALRRTPVDELVIAPYACVMATQILPLPAWRNLKALEALGARQRYGFIEALDYTPSRQTAPGLFTAVGTFMAHHQGMSLVALANVLRGGVVQRWGMANPGLQAIASLLHERTPREISTLYTLPSGLPAQMLRKRQPGLLRIVTPGLAAVEPTHLLSNGKYSVALRANGAGWSRWGTVGLSRWRDDLLRDAYGHFFYLDGLTSNRHDPVKPLVSLTQHPAADPHADYQSTFHADRVCFATEWKKLSAQMTVWVSPEDDIEFRQVELHNRSAAPLELELISAFELTLADARADEAHPAFSGMFVRGRWQAQHRALVWERKPRIATDKPVHAAHFLAHSDAAVQGLRICTARAQWLGRNRDATNPQAQLRAVTVANDVLGASEDQDLFQETELDPVSVLAVRLHIAPLGRVKLIFATAAAASAETLHAVLDKYLQCSHIERASLMSATLAGIRLRALQISAEQFAALQSLCTALLWSVVRPDRRSHARSKAARAVCDRRLLWRFGISGDRPIVLVSVGVVQGAGMLRSLAKALRLWAWSGLSCDLVVLNFEPNSYAMALQREIDSIGERLAADAVTATSPTALHLLRAQELSGDELSTLRSLARLRLHADGRPLAHHLQEWLALHEAALGERDEDNYSIVPVTRTRLAISASHGSFDARTGAFAFAVGAALRPPRPWSNVLANPDFGTVLTESGGGFSWASNSRLHQITAWSNDLVSDPCTEWFLLQDTRTGSAYSLTPNAWGDARASYSVSHGQGSTTMAHQRGDLALQVSWCVDPVHCIKSVQVTLHNTGWQAHSLRLVGLVEWIMGANRTDRNTCITSVQQSPGSTSVLCNQRAQEGGFGDSTAFLTLIDTQPHGRNEVTWTCDRREFFNAGGHLVLPGTLGARSGEGLDPCAALSVAFRIDAGARAEFVFRLGHAPTLAAASTLLAQANQQSVSASQAAVAAYWDDLLGNCTVRTPDPLLDVLVNRWFLYQAVSCRMWAKAGLYQAGGATGFRDQLQDSMALAWSRPALLRQQIVLCASRQFAPGDVQHWWHAPTGVGVRTHFSDDLLWLPHALAHYLQATGDVGVLEQRVPFLQGPEIAAGAEDAYFTPTVSEELASVWEHAARTLDASLRVGAHGLPLMGSGDWNDGMNAVGHEGQGESVWLGWFVCQIVAHMAPLARSRGELPRAQAWEAAAAACKVALATQAWDGQWFRRAFFDNGAVLGSAANAECRIDMIAQAWSVLSGAASVPMQALAMDSAHAQLVDRPTGLVKLLAPPLQHSQPSPGYIQAYPPGVRENGGQYAHAGVWALMAQVRLHHSGATTSADGEPRCDLAYRYFTYLSPAHRAAHPDYGTVYGLEPYAMAADVYGAAPYAGRGGWSWYTGAAGLMHRAVVTSLLGLQQEATHLRLTPCLPTHWNEAELTLRRDGKRLHFILLRTTAAGAPEAARQRQAQLLKVGQSLAWQVQPDEERYLIPLPLIN